MTQTAIEIMPFGCLSRNVLDAIMRRAAVVIVSSLPLLAIANSGEELPTDRVVQFLTNVYTGGKMDPKSWLLPDTRGSKQFKAFGGLDALIQGSTKEAHRYGGLQSVVVTSAVSKQQSYAVVARVTFFDESAQRTGPATAGREEKDWRFVVSKESGVWKLSF
jgi:hypothetical protein